MLTLDPQEVYKAGPCHIREYYMLDTPGTYEIVGAYFNDFSGIEYAVYAWTGLVRADPIRIDLSAPNAGQE